MKISIPAVFEKEYKELHSRDTYCEFMEYTYLHDKISEAKNSLYRDTKMDHKVVSALKSCVLAIYKELKLNPPTITIYPYPRCLPKHELDIEYKLPCFSPPRGSTQWWLSQCRSYQELYIIWQ